MNDRPGVVPASAKKTTWAWAVGTFFGVGLLKPGPGTWGSMAATALWGLGAYAVETSHFALTYPSGNMRMATQRPFLVVGALLGACAATAVGIPAATRVARESGREDPGHVVIDEVAGQWLTLAACKPDWQHALVALALFRVFDITKPWPARQLEALPGGRGIMYDDLAAGLYGLLALLVIQHWW